MMNNRPDEQSCNLLTFQNDSASSTNCDNILFLAAVIALNELFFAFCDRLCPSKGQTTKKLQSLTTVLHTGYIEVFIQGKCGRNTETTFDIKGVIGTYGN